LSRTSQTTRGYKLGEILKSSHRETPSGDKVELKLGNYDGALTALNFEHYKAEISYGYHTGITPATWAAGTAYSLEDVVIPTTPNGYQYKCRVAGTSQVPIGSSATDRATNIGGVITIIDLANPLGGAGTVTSVDIWANVNLPSDCKVGIFYSAGGTDFTCRAFQSIGAVTAGSKQTVSVSLAGQAGDYIGIYYNGPGSIERSATGGSGCYYYSGDATDGTYTYDVLADDAISLQGHVAPTWPTTLGTTVADNTVTWEMDGNSGDEYSRCAPLRVRGQELHSGQGILNMILQPIGILDQLGEDKAIAEYTQLAGDTNTVKTLISAVCAASTGLSSAYNGYTAITVVYDSEDSLIDVFIPADFFSIKMNETRLAKLEELLSYTGCKMRPGNDGKLHIFVPTISGTTYGYEYKFNVSGDHNFWNKTLRSRFVNPNKEIVKTPTGISPAYTGNATSATSFALDPKTHTTERRIVSNAQGTAIAGAIIESTELDAEKGFAVVPMNCGQELWDYVKATDSRENDTNTGNIQYIERIVEVHQKKPLTWVMMIAFGKTSLSSIMANMLDSGLGGSIGSLSSDQILAMYDSIISYLESQKKEMTWIEESTPENLDDIADGLSYQRVLATQISAGKIYLSSDTTFSTGYNPVLKANIFRQTSIPTSLAIGDLWFDSDDGNKLYRAEAVGATTIAAGQWVVAPPELANATKTGEWYKATGVVLDATYGASLYGAHVALRTFASITAYNTWLAGGDIDSLTGVQCYVGTDGAIYAGAGAVKLNVNGIYISGDSQLSTPYVNMTDVAAPTTVRGYLRGNATEVELYTLTGIDILLTAISADIYLVPGSGKTYFGAGIYIGNASGHFQIVAPTTKHIYLYPDLGDAAGSRYVLPDIDSEISLGASNLKFLNGYFDNLPACPVPTSNAAIEVIKKIKAPTLMTDDRYGKRHHFKDDDFPDEMKMDKVIIDKDGKAIQTGEREIEFIRTIGILVQAVRELTEKVEVLETR